MKFSFTAISRVILEHNKGNAISNHVATDIILDVDIILNKSTYLDKDDLPTQEGSRVLSMTLTQGLIACIHQSHQHGFRDSAEHLRFIISELERGFAQVAKVEKGKF